MVEKRVLGVFLAVGLTGGIACNRSGGDGGEGAVHARFSGDESAETPGGEAGPCERRIMPWVEANEGRESTLAQVVEGLRGWSKLTDTAIVSTVPGQAELYRSLGGRVPGMRIVPGVKTWTILPRFDSVAGWSKVAAECRAMCEAAGVKELLLENETAIRSYRRGEQDFDAARFREGISQLPKDVSYIWYPSIHGGNDRVQKLFEEVCRIAGEELDVRFVERHWEGPDALDNEWMDRAQVRLKRVSKRPTIPILYFYEGERWWQFAEAPEAFGAAGCRDVIVYPGSKLWVRAAGAITQALSADALD